MGIWSSLILLNSLIYFSHSSVPINKHNVFPVPVGLSSRACYDYWQASITFSIYLTYYLYGSNGKWTETSHIVICLCIFNKSGLTIKLSMYRAYIQCVWGISTYFQDLFYRASNNLWRICLGFFSLVLILLYLTIVLFIKIGLARFLI